MTDAEWCKAKIRPFPDPREMECGLVADAHDFHESVLRDYAYPGSSTVLKWAENDRRNFRGDWAPCTGWPCILPAGHRGEHQS